MRALVTGATGLIGRHLVARLDAPRVLCRDPEKARLALGVSEAVSWDSGRAVPAEALEGVDVVFHLAGEPVAEGRLTTARKQKIRDSRVLGTRSVVTAMGQARPRPRVLVCASAIGFYGSRGEEALDEDSAKGLGFLADVCAAWEEEARTARAADVRVVWARLGIVLARSGGALAKMRPAYAVGLGGPLGSGEQWMSFVHIEDAVGLLLHAAERADVAGPLNVCSPRPERNAEFSRALGRAMHRPVWVRAPAAALRLAWGELADVVMASQRVVPAKARATGYAFRFETLDETLRDLLAPASAR